VAAVRSEETSLPRVCVGQAGRCERGQHGEHERCVNLAGFSRMLKGPSHPTGRKSLQVQLQMLTRRWVTNRGFSPLLPGSLPVARSHSRHST
jgi:hypothetical protein